MTCSPFAYGRLGWGWAIALPVAVVAGLAPLPAAADMTSDYFCWIELPDNRAHDLEGLCGGEALTPGFSSYGSDSYWVDGAWVDLDGASGYSVDGSGSGSPWSTSSRGDFDPFGDPAATAIYAEFANMYLGLMGFRPEESLGLEFLNFLMYCNARSQGLSLAEFRRELDSFVQDSSATDRANWDRHWQALITAAEATRVCRIIPES